jgi:hypothetical protein
VVKWAGIERILGFGIFESRVQRRGAHVNIPEIGSRGALFVFGGIMGICAELRREYNWGNLNWGFFEGLFGVPRRCIEEGGTVVFPPRDLGEVLC